MQLGCLLNLFSPLLFAENLHVDLVFSSGKQRTVFKELSKQFAKEHPEINVISHVHQQERYKEKVVGLLTEGDSDILFGFAGASFNAFAKQGWIATIDDLWQEKKWDQSFSKVAKAAVMVNMKPYALPLSYYQWGFYYRKSIFKAHHLSPPETWQEFLQLGRVLQSKGVTPIALGSKERWTVAGWFDYLNLRINGLQFHRDLMAGKVAYNDARVKDLFRHWKILLDSAFFLDKHNENDWRQALPYLYRGKAGMLLMGNFIIPQIPQKIVDDIGFFRFPQIKADLPFYEEAPLDILIIPQRAKNKAQAKLFLAFMARKDIQEKMNQQMGMISPNKHAQTGDNIFIQAGAHILEESEGISQFYDRDTVPEMFNPGMDAMLEFMKNPDEIDSILNKLEIRRQQVFN